MLQIIYQDDNLLVVAKPPGLAVFSDDPTAQTIASELIKQFPGQAQNTLPPRYGSAHRLDKDTSGVLLVARNEATLLALQQQFKTRAVTKTYIALVLGQMPHRQDTIVAALARDSRGFKQKSYLANDPEAPKGLRKAETRYRVLEQFADFNLLELTPLTGRKHQLRCHLAFVGHPIAGDQLYGFKNQLTPIGLTRQFLHASSIAIKTSTK